MAVDADGCLAGQRLDKERHAQISARLDGGIQRINREFGILDVVERQQLLRQRLVGLQIIFARAAARERYAQEVEQPGDVDMTEVGVAERFDEIENHVRLPSGDAL